MQRSAIIKAVSLAALIAFYSLLVHSASAIEKALPEKSTAEKAATEKPAAAKPAADKSTAEKSTPEAKSPKGSLVIVGGALRYNNGEVWSRIVELASSPQDAPHQVASSNLAATPSTQKPRIAVFPTASVNPTGTGNRIAKALAEYGADAFVVPVALQNVDRSYEEAVADPALVASVKSANGIFFSGGEQRRITTALLTKDGKPTPMLEAIWSVYRRGGVVAGTSAGAAVMSAVMCRSARSVLGTLQNGVTMGKECDNGLGFLDSNWFVDQHAIVRGRFARALVIMKTHNLKYGVGIDENTALEVCGGRDARVIGDRGALVLDISQAKDDNKLGAFNLTNARLTYLEHGDKIDLKSLNVTPAPEKQAGQKLVPKSPDFQPTENLPLFSPDILGNTTVADMLVRLIQSRREEAIGLAFDGEAARQQSISGFEFRFYRGDDSAGWTTSAFGGEAFTVTNIRLDVHPVQIAGPLYTRK